MDRRSTACDYVRRVLSLSVLEGGLGESKLTRNEDKETFQDCYILIISDAMSNFIC